MTTFLFFLFMLNPLPWTLCLSEDGKALLLFKTNLTPDSQALLSSWNASAQSPCPWTGISCNRFQRVTTVDLPSLGLDGTIHPNISALGYLRRLDLSNNLLKGSIPLSVGNLRNLQELILGTNYLSGTIPAELGNLTQLTSLSLSVNNFNGSIPSQLAKCRNLSFIDLGNNFLESIPPEFGNMQSLKHLSLYINSLTGEFPLFLTGCRNLEALDGPQPKLSTRRRFIGAGRNAKTVLAKSDVE